MQVCVDTEEPVMQKKNIYISDGEKRGKVHNYDEKYGHSPLDHWNVSK